MHMNEFLDFRKMITPTIIKIIFWIGAGVSLLTGFGLIIAGMAASGEAGRYGYQGGVPSGVLVLLGLLEMVFGPLLVRISCELTILFFRIYETLNEIRDNGRGTAPALAPTYAPSSPQPNPAYPTL